MQRKLALALALWLGLAAGCALRPSPTSNTVSTTDDLARSLLEAGVEVSEESRPGWSLLGQAGRVIQVDGAEIQVFEYRTVEERAAISGTISPDGSAAGGEEAPWPDRANLWATGRIIVVYAGTDGGTILLLSGLLGDSMTVKGSQPDEPYPPAVVEAIRVVAEKAGVPPQQIEVERFEEVDWPDSCLGLATADEMCAQVITPGYRVILNADGNRYEVHTDALGANVRAR